SNSNSESNYKFARYQFTGIGKEIELGEEVFHKVYKEKYIHCNKEFKHAKHTKTRAYIIYECLNCPKNIK
ncbi:3716_t:CDS:1, partial [Cetraspora pellucida]